MGSFVVAVLMAVPAVAAVEHYQDTYQEYDGDGLVAASAGWEHDTWQGVTAHRALGVHESIGLPGQGTLYVCGTSSSCGNIKDTCLVPDGPLNPISCLTASPLLYSGCAWAYTKTENIAGDYVFSLHANTGHC